MANNKEKIMEDLICPNCHNKLVYSLKRQVLGNNCGCGFPNEFQRSKLYLFYNWLIWQILKKSVKK